MFVSINLGTEIVCTRYGTEPSTAWFSLCGLEILGFHCISPCFSQNFIIFHYWWGFSKRACYIDVALELALRRFPSQRTALELSPPVSSVPFFCGHCMPLLSPLRTQFGRAVCYTVYISYIYIFNSFWEVIEIQQAGGIAVRVKWKVNTAPAARSICEMCLCGQKSHFGFWNWTHYHTWSVPYKHPFFTLSRFVQCFASAGCLIPTPLSSKKMPMLGV